MTYCYAHDSGCGCEPGPPSELRALIECPMCGDRWNPLERANSQITAAGGFCIPKGMLEEMFGPDLTKDYCGDCKSRYLFAIEMGFDPGRHCENLKVPRASDYVWNYPDKEIISGDS